VNNQLSYLKTRPLGFDSEQVLVTKLRTPAIRREGEVLLNAFERTAGVNGVTASSSLLGNGANGVLFIPEGVERGADGVAMATMNVRQGFIEQLNIPLAAGRAFDPNQPTDTEVAYVVNRQAAQIMGWTPEEAVGKELAWPSSMDGSTPNVREGSIVGVVENFHFTSLHTLVEPLVMIPVDASPSYVMTRISSTDVSGTLSRLQDVWNGVLPNDAFDSFFLDEHFAGLYESEARSARMFGLFSGLAILLAGLGLLGLASYTTSRRTREIGIRKVMGASSGSILRMLASEFSLLVMVAFMVATPIAWFAMEQWLSNFPYRIEPGVSLFLIAGIAAFVITMFTVGFHSLRAAWSDPIEAIRYE